MRVLLDTHVFLWSKSNDPRMSGSAWSILRDPGNELFMSAMSVAEIAIKFSIKKLKLDQTFDQLVGEGMANGGIFEIPFRTSHATRLNRLPLHHRDPFDRMILATAVEEDLFLLSDDRLFGSYDVRLIW